MTDKQRESAEIINANKDYWTDRAASYSSMVVEEELYNGADEKWFQIIDDAIKGALGDTAPADIRVLDIGTGPGFFPIILARAGYKITAIDLTPSMLDNARKNAGELCEIINFAEMNAEALDFDNESFHVIVTRNLTWNLPHPDVAYKEWVRVLKSGGILLNFDANWYRYLYDEKAREAYKADHENASSQGISDETPDVDYDVMETIAEMIPLSQIYRPQWDIQQLSQIGCTVDIDSEIWRKLWSDEEKILYASTPMFLVKAIKL